MNPEAMLRRSRVRAESLMADAGVMRRPTGRTVMNAQDQEVEVFEDLFTSKCKIQSRNLQAAIEEAGGRSAVTVRAEVHLPVTAPPVQTGDVWEVTRLGSLSDLQLLGRKFRVVSPVGKSYATARRLEVEEVVA